VSLSLRIDTVELIAGSLVIGDAGHGVAGAAIPTTGTHGPAFAYDSVVLQAGYADKEYRGTITAVSAGVDIVAAEDTSFNATGPVGSHTIEWSLYENGVFIGSSTFTLQFG